MNYVPSIFFIIIAILSIWFAVSSFLKGRLWPGITFLIIALVAAFLIQNYDIIKKITLGKWFELETFKRDITIIKEEAIDEMRREINKQADKIQKLINEEQETKTKVKEQIKTTEIMSSNYNVLEKRVSIIENNNKSKLNKEFQDYQVAGIKEKDIIIPKGEQPKEFNIDWSSAKVLKDNNEQLTILLPNITSKSLVMHNNTLVIKKEVGAKAKMIKIGNYSLEAEVLSVQKELTVIAIGMVKL